MPSQIKTLIVKELTERYRDKADLVLVDLTGTDAQALQQLRETLDKNSVKLEVVKNSLAKLAFREIGLEALAEHLEGPSAIAIGADDIVTLAKALTEATKTFQKLTFKAGVGEGRLLSGLEVGKLAQIASREVLLSQVAGSFFAPLSGFAIAVNGILRKLVIALDAIKELRSKERYS
jgi:large subunit ribosomal protein L10